METFQKCFCYGNFVLFFGRPLLGSKKFVNSSKTNISDSIKLIENNYDKSNKEVHIILEFIRNSNRGLI